MYQVALDVAKYDTSQCPGLMDAYAPPVLFVLDHAALQPQQVCDRLNYCIASERISQHRYRPVAQKPEPAIPARKHDPAAGTYSIVHLTDLHYDYLYAPNSNSECNDFLCCREYNGPGNAGVFGSYQCDLPLNTIQDMLDHIGAISPAPDAILFTG